MPRSIRPTAVSLAVLLASIQPSAMVGAEIKALITIGVQSAIEDLGPKFEKLSGDKLAIAYGLSAPLSKRVADGEAADLFVGAREGVDSLIKSGKIRPDSQLILAQSGIGLAVRKGTPKPDISTPEALKRTLLTTRSIGFGNPTAGGAAGVIFAKVIERLGIVDEMKSKTRHPVPGSLVGSMLVSGEVELAVQQIPELIAVDGVELVGPLPGELQTVTVFAGGIPTGAVEPSAARAFLTFLRSPEAAAVMKSKGLDVPNL
jgi:molybdate transport system substrate-binding protein